MKYEIHVNQRAIIEHGFDLDLVDGAIMDFCRFFSGGSGCGFMVEDGKRYYWFSHKLICEQLPILRLKPDSAYRRMKGLCDKLFLEAHPKNKQKNASWYCFGKLADLLVGTIGNKSEPSDSNPKVDSQTIGLKSEPTDSNPMGIGSKSDGPTDQNPMYKEIIDKEKNYKEERGAIANALPPAPPEKKEIETLEEKKEEPLTPDSAPPPSPKREPMQRPTIEQVRTHFALGMASESLADKFFNYYESNGWIVGKAPMRKWQAAANNWISDEKQSPQRHAVNPTKNHANGRLNNPESVRQFGNELDAIINQRYGTGTGQPVADGGYAVVVDDPGGGHL